MSIHANPVRVAPTVSVGRSTDRLFAHACPLISDLHLDVDQNVLPVLNVHWIRHASTRNVSILVQELAALMQDAMSTIIVPFAHVNPDTLEIRSHDAIPIHVRSNLS